MSLAKVARRSANEKKQGLANTNSLHAESSGLESFGIFKQLKLILTM